MSDFIIRQPEIKRGDADAASLAAAKYISRYLWVFSASTAMRSPFLNPILDRPLASRLIRQLNSLGQPGFLENNGFFIREALRAFPGDIA
jgi:hypothetical protein